MILLAEAWGVHPFLKITRGLFMGTPQHSTPQDFSSAIYEQSFNKLLTLGEIEYKFDSAVKR